MRRLVRVGRSGNSAGYWRLLIARLFSSRQDVPTQSQDAAFIGRSRVPALFALLIPAFAVIGLASVGAHGLALVLILVLISAGR